MANAQLGADWGNGEMVVRGLVRWLALVLLGATLALCSGCRTGEPLRACQLYAAPDGAGEACTRRAPCALAGAQAKARSLIPTMSGDVVVCLRGGNYVLTETLTFSEADSGQNGHQVVYGAYRQETPRLSGGQIVDGWELAGAGVYRAQADGLVFRQVYVNGERRVRARTPNRESDLDFGPYYRCDWGTDRVTAKGVAGVTLSEASGAELVIVKHWDQSRLRLATYQAEGDWARLTFMEPEASIEWSQQFPPKEPDQSCYLENAPGFLDAPGEWYLDAGTDELRYIPLPGEALDQVEVVVPVLERLLDVDGAHDLEIRGLVLEYAAWQLPDTARVGGQSGCRPPTWDLFIPGAVRLANTQHVRLVGNRFEHLGGSGLELAYGTLSTEVIDNTFTDISGNGITIYTDVREARPTESRGSIGDVIRGNRISRVGQEYTGAAGINATYPSSITISDNELWDMPYTGISLGWGWTSEETALRDNVVARNTIHHVMQLHDDGAGIYTLSKQPDTRLVDNVIRDIKRSDWAGVYPIAGIYLDEQSSGITLELNVIENVPEEYNFHKVGVYTVIGNDVNGERLRCVYDGPDVSCEHLLKE